MPKIVPNLHFYHGTCEEALSLYGRAFGAQTTVLIRNQDASPADQEASLTEAQRQYVFHAEMLLAGQRVLMSDELEGERPQAAPVSLTVLFETPEAARRAYDVLLPGARVIHPMTGTTYAGAFGALMDRFGIRWELMNENESLAR